MLRQLRLEAAKWGQTIQISLAQKMAYKLHFVLFVLGSSIIFFFVKYNLWTSIYSLEGVGELQGYDLRQMLAYQTWVMIVSFLGQSYNSLSLSEDIRLGRISAYLVYPFDFWQYQTAGYLALQLLQMLVAAVTLLLTWGLGWIELPGAGPLLAGTGMALLVGWFWFAVNYVLGLVAFWLEETWVLRVMFVTISSVLSGAIMPLEIYPDWARTLLNFTPFPYVTFVPVKIYMAEYTGSVLQAALTILAWTVVTMLLAAAVWKRGMRLYSAAGM